MCVFSALPITFTLACMNHKLLKDTIRQTFRKECLYNLSSLLCRELPYKPFSSTATLKKIVDVMAHDKILGALCYYQHYTNFNSKLNCVSVLYLKCLTRMQMYVIYFCKYNLYISDKTWYIKKLAILTYGCV